MTAMYSSGPLSKYRAAPRRSGNSRWGEVCKENLEFLGACSAPLLGPHLFL